MKKWLIIVGVIYPFIVAAQNVGIGISQATRARLEVAGAVGRTVAILGSNDAGVSFLRNNAGIGFNVYHNGTNYQSMVGDNGMVLELDASIGALAFRTFTNGYRNGNYGPSVNRLMLFNNGQVVINGSQRMNATLYVGRPFDGVTGAQFFGTTYSTIINEGLSGNTFINGGKTGSDVLINDVNTGTVYWGGTATRVGINNISPEAILDIHQVNGLGVIWVVPTNFRNWEFRVFKNKNETGSDYRVNYNDVNLGNFSYVDGKYYNYSDKRLKEQIRPMGPVISKLMELTPASYRFHDAAMKGKRSLGFSAQQMAGRFPEIVYGMSGAGMGYPELDTLQMMNYNQLGVLAVQAIKEQQELIEKLRQTNKKLNEEINLLEKHFTQTHKQQQL